MKRLLMMALLGAAPVAAANPGVGEKPAPVTISGEEGGRVDGQAWSSDMIKDKAFAFFYVDPDAKDINGDMEQALKAEAFPKERYGSIAVINMDATWLPNAAIASSLKSKQEEFPEVTYVKDLKKKLVTAWKMKDDDYDVLVFAPDGKVVFSRSGQLSKADIAEMIAAIKANMPPAP
jgi:predicted transcriptional regulator